MGATFRWAVVYCRFYYRTQEVVVLSDLDTSVAAQNLVWVEQYLVWHDRHRGSSNATVVSYRSTLGMWAMWHAPSDILTASRSDLEAFVDRPRMKRGHGNTGAPRTRRRDVTILKGFYRWLTAEGATTTNIAGNLAAPKILKKEPQPVPRDVWLDVWNQDMPSMMRVVLGLGHFVGLRRGEIATLKGTHFNTDNKLKGFIRKGGGEHTVPWLEMVETVTWRMPEHKTKWTNMFVDELRETAQMTGDHPLLSPWSQNLNQTIVNRKYIQHGIPFTPHRTRDSCATNLVEHCGVDIHIVCDLLNHGSIQVTMGYVKVASNSLANWRAKQ